MELPSGELPVRMGRVGKEQVAEALEVWKGHGPALRLPLRTDRKGPFGALLTHLLLQQLNRNYRSL